MPLIKIVATGGTIANTSHGFISIDDVLGDLPQARSQAKNSKSSRPRVYGAARFGFLTGSTSLGRSAS